MAWWQEADVTSSEWPQREGTRGRPDQFPAGSWSLCLGALALPRVDPRPPGRAQALALNLPLTETRISWWTRGKGPVLISMATPGAHPRGGGSPRGSTAAPMPPPCAQALCRPHPCQRQKRRLLPRSAKGNPLLGSSLSNTGYIQGLTLPARHLLGAYVCMRWLP